MPRLERMPRSSRVKSSRSSKKIAPEFVSWLEENVDEGLTVFDFPRSWWRRIRTINGLERLHREIRRRTRVVGIFPHEASALRLISAVLAEIHEEWLTGRQYLNLAGWEKTSGAILSLQALKKITEKRLLNPKNYSRPGGWRYLSAVLRAKAAPGEDRVAQSGD